MKNKLTPELIEKAKLAKSAEEISDDALDKVAGGARICGVGDGFDMPVTSSGEYYSRYKGKPIVDPFGSCKYFQGTGAGFCKNCSYAENDGWCADLVCNCAERWK